MAAQSPGGTSYPVFKDFPIPFAGKTGASQRRGQDDQSWCAGLAPYPNPRYVVVATFEQGGFGVETAAPAVRKIMSVLFGIKDKGGSKGSTAGGNQYGSEAGRCPDTRRPADPPTRGIASSAP